MSKEHFMAAHDALVEEYLDDGEPSYLAKPIPLDVLGHLIPRFWKCVPTRWQPVCWEWTGPRSPQGYGRLNYKSVGYVASRVSMLIHGIPIGTWQLACHHCDNPACVNPAHLYAGNERDNAADCKERGRRNSRVGSLHHLARLDEQRVREIKLSTGTAREIAEQYGISPNHARDIIKGKRWGHVV